MLLSPNDGTLRLSQVLILPPSESIAVHPPVPLLLQNPPLDTNILPPSFAAAVQEPQILETLPELLDRLNLCSADSLRKYTKKVLHEMVDMCQVGIQGQSREDVQIRLGLMDDQWRDDKLSEMAKIKLGCLASALKNFDLKQADKLHLALMVDHITEVSQWMVGVKRIMNELKVLQSPSQPTTPRKFLISSGTTTSAKRTLATEKPVVVNNHCNNTDISDNNLVYLPEVLISNTNNFLQQNSTIQQVNKKQTGQNRDIVVNNSDRASDDVR